MEGIILNLTGAYEAYFCFLVPRVFSFLLLSRCVCVCVCVGRGGGRVRKNLRNGFQL